MNQVQRPPSSTARTGWRSRPEAIAMWQPAASAMRAAVTLVIMPPLPNSVAASPAMASISGVTAWTSATSFAAGSRVGSAVCRPSVSDSSSRQSALIIWATRAARRSLSP
jgi:hypothetical protein